MILSTRFACAEDLLRFRLEGETAASLQHPNIVQVYDVGAWEGQPYMVLEYIEGGTLAQKLNGEPLPAEQAARLVEVLARAVHVAHDRGIVHRDLKPSNILLAVVSGQGPVVSEDKETPSALITGHWSLSTARHDALVPKITDFGLARRLDRAGGLTETGCVLGTPEYMAPEQAAGRTRDIGPHTDVYSLGAILYELLAGRPPFQATGSTDTILQVLIQEPAPLRKLQAKAPRDLETICAAAWRNCRRSAMPAPPNWLTICGGSSRASRSTPARSAPASGW